MIQVDTIVLKFGGSSVADNDKLKLVAEKIIELYQKNHNIVVVVSAQGKTTDKYPKKQKIGKWTYYLAQENKSRQLN